MSRWYRAYQGTVSDPKIAEAALVAGVSRSVAVAVWHGLLEGAAATQDGGRHGTTSRRIAAMLGEPPPIIEALFAAFDEIGLTTDGMIVAWSKRQYESDNSTERSRKCREGKRNASATLRQQEATPPDTDTDTDTDTDKKQQQHSLPRGPDEAAAAVDLGRDEFSMVDHLCRQALGEAAPVSPVIAPMMALIRAGYRIERICDVLRSEARRPRRSPVKTWELWRTIVQDVLAAPQPPPPRLDDQSVKSWELPFRQWKAARGHWPGGKYGPSPLEAGCMVPGDVLRARAAEIASARDFMAEAAPARRKEAGRTA